MGQKVNPHGLRVGIIKDWDSKWFADKNKFAEYLIEDAKVREYLKKKAFAAGVSRIRIERTANRLIVNIDVAKPGLVIGKGGVVKDELQKDLEKMTGRTVSLNVFEVKAIDLDAQLCAENIASQLERRISYRRAMKQVMTRSMRVGALGIKTEVSGRLGGAEIARSEHYHEGSIPLQTIRADIDYGFAEADTTYGKLGVKVWIYKGEVLPAASNKEEKDEGGEA